MPAVKVLGWSMAAWFGLGLVAARAEAISKSEAHRLWTMVMSASEASSSQVSQAASVPATTSVNAASTSAAAPATASAPATTSTSVTPIFAGASNAAAVTSAPATASVPTPAAAPLAATATSSVPAGTVDAFINMTAGPYPSASSLTTGTAQPWYDSPSVIQAFGGVPNSQQQASFVQTVLQDVQHTYQLSGMDPTLTTNPNTPALHTISVVSGLSYGPNPDAIGITNVGGNGFSFIDKLDYANNPTDLAWAVAHNVSHELMHAFGIGYHPDGGNYVDAATANWSTLIDPNAQFGPAATQLLLASQYGTLSGSNPTLGGVGAEVLNPDGTKVDGDEVVATPEPATIAMWVFGGLGGVLVLRRRAAA